MKPIRKYSYFICFFVILSLILVPVNTFASEADTFSILQVEVQKAALKAVVSIKESNGIPVPAVKKEQVSASINEIDIPVEGVDTFEKSGQGIGYIFLMDTSLSIDQKHGEQMRSAINRWIDQMRDDDSAAIVTFGSEVKQAQDFTNDRFKLKSVVQGILPKDMNTKLYEGISYALDLAKAQKKEIPVHRVIILLSDGRDESEGLIRKEVLDKQIAEFRIPIYSIGFWDKTPTETQKSYLNLLEGFSIASRGQYFAGGNRNLEEVYEKVLKQIKAQYIVSLSIPDLTKLNGMGHLKLSFNTEKGTVSDTLDIKISAEPLPAEVQKDQDKSIVKEEKRLGNEQVTKAAPPERVKKTIFSVYLYMACAIILFLICTAGLIIYRKRKTAERKVKWSEPILNQTEIRRQKLSERLAETVEVQKEISKETEEGSGIKIKLIVLNENGSRQVFETYLKGRIKIGADSSNEVSIEGNPTVELCHAEIFLEFGMIITKNMEPWIETFVNGMPLKGRRRLEDGDIMYVGNTIIRIYIG